MAGPPLTPLAPWRWLQQAVALLRARTRALVGATSLLMAVALAPSVVQHALAPVAPQLATLLALALALLLFPPAVAGYFRLVHALAQGAQAPPGAIFAVFADGATVRRMILAHLMFVSGALLVTVVLVSVLGGEPLMRFLEQVSALQPGAKDFPPLPPGALPLLVVLGLFALALGSAQALAYAEIALSSRAPLPAIAAGLRATARHFGILLLFYVPVAVFAFLAFMLVALVAVLLGGALQLLAPALAPILVLVLSLLLVLAMYSLLFTFFYYAWRELFAGAAGAPPQSPPPPHEIAA